MKLGVCDTKGSPTLEIRVPQRSNKRTKNSKVQKSFIDLIHKPRKILGKTLETHCSTTYDKTNIKKCRFKFLTKTVTLEFLLIPANSAFFVKRSHFRQSYFNVSTVIRPISYIYFSIL